MEYFPGADEFALWVEVESVNMLVSDCVNFVSSLPSDNEQSERVLKSRVSATHRVNETCDSPLDPISDLALGNQMIFVACSLKFDSPGVCFAGYVIHPVS